MLKMFLTVSVAFTLISCGSHRDYNEASLAPAVDAEFRGGGSTNNVSKAADQSASSQAERPENPENASAATYLAYR